MKVHPAVSTTSSYEAELILAAKARGVHTAQSAERSGEAGRARLRGKLVLSEAGARNLPGNAMAHLEVAVAGESYGVRSKRGGAACAERSSHEHLESRRPFSGVGSTKRTKVRLKGVEPPRPFGHGDLNAARLPVPPQPRGDPAI